MAHRALTVCTQLGGGYQGISPVAMKAECIRTQKPCIYHHTVVCIAAYIHRALCVVAVGAYIHI